MTKNKLPKVIVVIGPTATNKTKLAIFLAQKLNGEIVNADAFQVYKELNIGVNKPTTKELKQAQFHLLSCVSIYDEWDIKRFQDEAKTTIDDIFARHKIPIIVGGSHLYVNALIQNYDLTRVPKRDQKYAHLTTPELYNMLLTRDSDRAQKIGPHNQQRLVRALQIFDYPPTTNKLPIYDPLFISCIRPRPSLYAHINQRVLVMLKKD
jgi:tRNA dimethylallyltransferase